MSFGNGVAPARDLKELNGKNGVRLTPSVLSILLALFTFIGGWFASQIRSDAAMNAVLAEHTKEISEIKDTTLTKDQFNQFQQEFKAWEEQTQTQLMEIRSELGKRH